MRRLATLLALALVLAPLAASSARPLPAPVSAPGDFAADSGHDLPIACRRWSSTSVLTGVVAGARGAAVCSRALPDPACAAALARRAARRGPRAITFARFHRKHAAPARSDPAEPPLAL